MMRVLERGDHCITFLQTRFLKRVRISTPSLLEEGNRRVYKLTRQYLYLSKTVTSLEWVTGWIPDHGLYGGGVCKTKLSLYRTWRGGCWFSSFWVVPRSELCWVPEIHDNQVEGDSEFVHDNRQEGRLEHMFVLLLLKHSCWLQPLLCIWQQEKMASARKEVTLVKGSMICRMNICETL
jgi:hypothetical protein